jgi:uncharacterized protein YjiS (DUF1127 family)
MEDSMNAYYELTNPGSSFQQAHADRTEQPGRQINAILRIGALRLVDGSALRRSLGWISLWRRRRTAIRELQALSDHHLADIGLDRSQIVSTVEKTIKFE